MSEALGVAGSFGGADISVLRQLAILASISGGASILTSAVRARKCLRTVSGVSVETRDELKQLLRLKERQALVSDAKVLLLTLPMYYLLVEFVGAPRNSARLLAMSWVIVFPIMYHSGIIKWMCGTCRVLMLHGEAHFLARAKQWSDAAITARLPRIRGRFRDSRQDRFGARVLSGCLFAAVGVMAWGAVVAWRDEGDKPTACLFAVIAICSVAPAVFAWLSSHREIEFTGEEVISRWSYGIVRWRLPMASITSARLSPAPAPFWLSLESSHGVYQVFVRPDLLQQLLGSSPEVDQS